MRSAGLPDLRIAIVTSDMGAGDGSISGCDATGGKNGIFQYTARGNCTATNLAAGATYIADDGTTKNFTGNLPDVFSCIASVGESGCGFEQELAAVTRALGADGKPAPAENQGFLRDDAYLYIAIVTDEDDCSVPPGSGLFDVMSNDAPRLPARAASRLPLQRIRPPLQRRQAAAAGAERRREREGDAGRMRLGRGRRHADARRDDRVATSRAQALSRSADGRHRDRGPADAVPDRVEKAVDHGYRTVAGDPALVHGPGRHLRRSVRPARAVGFGLRAERPLPSACQDNFGPSLDRMAMLLNQAMSPR